MTTKNYRSTAYDREVVKAAHDAAPIFAARGWVYGSAGDAVIPDYLRLMDVVQGLVDRARATEIDLDDNGDGETWASTGRWYVRRTIDAYACEPSDDDLTIMLALGTIEDPKIPQPVDTIDGIDVRGLS